MTHAGVANSTSRSTWSSHSRAARASAPKITIAGLTRTFDDTIGRLNWHTLDVSYHGFG